LARAGGARPEWWGTGSGRAPSLYRGVENEIGEHVERHRLPHHEVRTGGERLGCRVAGRRQENDDGIAAAAPRGTDDVDSPGALPIFEFEIGDHRVISPEGQQAHGHGGVGRSRDLPSERREKLATGRGTDVARKRYENVHADRRGGRGRDPYPSHKRFTKICGDGLYSADRSPGPASSRI